MIWVGLVINFSVLLEGCMTWHEQSPTFGQKIFVYIITGYIVEKVTYSNFISSLNFTKQNVDVL